MTVPRLLLGVAALALAVAFVLLPVDRQVVEYVWDAETDGTAVPLLLIERVPDRFDLRFPCPDATDDGRLFSSSRSPDDVPALLVAWEQGRPIVTVSTSEGDEPLLEGAPAEEAAPGCTVVVDYDRRGETLTLSSDGATITAEEVAEAFEVTGLHWAGEPTDVGATVRTSPASVARNSVPQRLALVLIVGLGIATAVLTWRTGAARQPRRRSWRVYASEWSMLLVAALVAAVDLPRVDDGRILARARHLGGTDLVANVAATFENRPLPQRWIHEWLLSVGVSWSNVIPVLRGVAMVAAVVAWILLRRHVLPALVGGTPRTPVVVTAWSVHATFVVAWFATLRPEPFLVLLTVAVLAIVASWPDHVRAWPYAATLACLGLAIATHVAGMVALLAAVPLIWRGLRELRQDPITVLTGVSWGAAGAVLAVFIGSNLQHWLLGVTAFRRGADHGHGPLDLAPYVSGAMEGHTAMRLSMAFFVTGAVALLAAAVARADWRFTTHRDAVLVGAAIAPLGLLFTPSKWLWHLAVLAPVAVVGWALIASTLGRRRRAAGPTLLTGAVFGLLVAWAMQTAWQGRVLGRSWEGLSLRHVTHEVWANRLPWLVGSGTRWWAWTLGMAALCAVVLWSRRRRGDPGPTAAALGAMTLAAAAAATVVQFLPPVIDAIVADDDEWTWVRQAALGVTSSRIACGVPAATPEVVERLDRQGSGDGTSLGGLGAGDTRAGLLMPCHTLIGQRNGVWQVPDIVMGELRIGQRRLSTEYDLVEIGCNSFPRGRADDHLCFSVPEPAARPLEPVSVEWRRHP